MHLIDARKWYGGSADLLAYLAGLLQNRCDARYLPYARLSPFFRRRATDSTARRILSSDIHRDDSSVDSRYRCRFRNTRVGFINSEVEEEIVILFKRNIHDVLPARLVLREPLQSPRGIITSPLRFTRTSRRPALRMMKRFIMLVRPDGIFVFERDGRRISRPCRCSPLRNDRTYSP